MATLYRKYRPQTFEEVIGQSHVVQTLQNALSADRLAHAYLFTGPRGVGKTSIARILAKAVNCTDPKNRPCGKCKNCLAIADGSFIDLIEIDAASNRGVDDIRDLREKINFAPSLGKKKVYIIDEVHMLTKEAFNALLKTLEEPPAHSIFIFATTEIHKVPQTIISRCQRFDFGFGSKEMILESIKKIASKEGLKMSDEIAELVYRVSGGSFRDAQSLLDQLSSHMTGKDFGIEDAAKILHLAEFAEINDFIEILKLNSASKSIQFLAGLREKGIDFEQFNHHLILRLRSMAIEKILEDKDGLWEIVAIKKFTEALASAKISPIDVLPLEIACIELAQKSAEVLLQVHSEATPQTDKKESKDEAKKHSVLSSEAKIAIIESVGSKNKPLASLLGSAIWVQDGKNIVIKVEYPFHKDTIMNKNNLSFIANCVDGLLEGPVKIDCEVCKSGEMDEDISEVFGLAS